MALPCASITVRTVEARLNGAVFAQIAGAPGAGVHPAVL
jgi:hypothetical protein